MQERTLQVTVSTWGKAPTKHGKNAYKIAPEDRRLLENSGWKHVGSGQHYEFLEAPAEQKFAKRKKALLTLRVPTNEEIEKMASEMHAESRAGAKMVGDALVKYRPAKTKVATLVREVDLSSGKETPLNKPVLTESAEFEFRVGSAFNAWCRWENGDDQPPRWVWSDHKEDQGRSMFDE